MGNQTERVTGKIKGSFLGKLQKSEFRRYLDENQRWFVVDVLLFMA